MFERFTDRARKAITLATTAAKDLDQQNFGPEHIIHGILNSGDGVTVSLLKDSGIDYETLRDQAYITISLNISRPDIEPVPTPSAEVDKIYEVACQTAADANCGYVGTEHLMIGVLQTRVGSNVCRRVGLDLETFTLTLNNLMTKLEPDDWEQAVDELLHLENEDDKAIVAAKEVIDGLAEELKLQRRTNASLRTLLLQIKEEVDHSEDATGSCLWIKEKLEEDF